MNHFFVFFIFLCLLTLPLRPLPAQQEQEEKSGVPETRGTEGNGLRADYFNDLRFEEKVLSRIEEEIDFYFHYESPAPGVNAENYTIRWTGSLYAPVSGTYKFIVTVDDGIRLWVNGKKVLDKWKLQQVTTYYNTIDLEGGEYYSIKIEYFNAPEYAIMKLMWESPEDRSSFFGFFESTARKIIPKKYLFGRLPDEEKPVVQDSPGTEEDEPLVVVRKQETENGKDTNDYPQPGKKEVPEEVAPNSPDEEVDESTFGDLKPGAVVQFRKVMFEQSKYDLLEESFPELDKLERTLQKYPGLKIRIEGHTDNVGDPRLNQSLSLLRAKAVAAYLLGTGIAPFRIEAEGFGDSRPLADNATEEGRAKNRRVEFVVK